MYSANSHCDESSRLVLAIWATFTWFPEQFDFFQGSVGLRSQRLRKDNVSRRFEQSQLSTDTSFQYIEAHISDLDKASTLLLDEVDNMGLDQRGLY